VDPIRLPSIQLAQGWLDAYGHLAGGAYGLAFERAGWSLASHFEIGESYFQETGCALYLVEAHYRYLKEVRAPATLDFEGMVFGVDEKRHWYGLRMSVENVERATCEYVEVHVDTRLGRSVSKPPSVLEAMRRALVPQRPAWAGQAISLDRRR
jgi:acyl-CoA thioester hydrolase